MVCAEFTKEVFAANYTHDLEISDKEIISGIIHGLGRNGQEIIALSISSQNKSKLKEQVNEAVNKGIFGAPSFIVNGELFWGNDRLEEAIEYCIK